MRPAKKVICSCGGNVVEADTTEAEDREYGCRTNGCCARAWQCERCRTRFLFSLEAPEISD